MVRAFVMNINDSYVKRIVEVMIPLLNFGAGVF
jgi:hypothetical protein